MSPDNQIPQNPLFNIPPKETPSGLPPAVPRQDDANQAVELIRNKIGTLYATEPDAKEEAAESNTVQSRSRHQEFMHSLSTSGKSLAEIQMAWHDYYQSLPDQEKHQVWKEFYDNHNRLSRLGQPNPSTKAHTTHHVAHPHPTPVQPVQTTKPLTAADIKQQLLGKITNKVSRKHRRNLKSLGFGLGMGMLTFVILMFGFFNERFVAPFVTPSRAVTSTPIISDTTTAVGSEPKIIIPKINVEIPAVYTEPAVDEGAVQRALEGGVLHYATSSNPGEVGNAVYFGHSSNNILNRGKYKFAFVLLNRLEPGDTFMLEKDSRRYIYKVTEKKIVEPNNLSVLDDHDKPTATLITCDPPGTSLKRLIVIGEQISPDPGSNVASTANKSVATPELLPSNAPTLWNRFWTWIST